MRKRLIILLVLACAVSCGQNKSQKVYPSATSQTIKVGDVSSEELGEDSDNLSWAEFVRKMTPLRDSLVKNALDDDPDNEDLILEAQKYGISLLFMAAEKWQSGVASGEIRVLEEWETAFGPLVDAVYVWHREPNCIYRDQYYESNKSAKNPVEVWLELVVSLPSRGNEPFLLIVYPDNAIDDVLALAFSNVEYITTDMTFDNDDIVDLEYRKPRNEKEGTPLVSRAGKEIVDKMLSNHFMFILYTSSDTPDGDPGEEESVCVNLDPFKKIWEESQRSN